jgi:hypothetical protein
MHDAGELKPQSLEYKAGVSFSLNQRWTSFEQRIWFQGFTIEIDNIVL